MGKWERACMEAAAALRGGHKGEAGADARNRALVILESVIYGEADDG